MTKKSSKKNISKLSSVWPNIENFIAIMPGNIYWKDRGGHYLGCNAKQAKALGLKDPEEVIGKTIKELLPNDAGNIEATDNLVMETGIEATLEEPLADGKTYLSKKIPIKDQSGAVIGLVGISFDITDRKKEEQKLKQERNTSQLTLDNILENIQGNIFWLDRNEVILGANKLQAEILGFRSPDDIVGKTVFEVTPPQVAEELHKVNQEVLATGRTVNVEELLTHQDGSASFFLSQKVPMRDYQGNIVGLLGIAFDITSKKQAEKLEKEKAVSEEKVQTMKMLAATIAHELRTPLASISALSTAIKVFLPALIEGYQLAEQHELPVSSITHAQIESLKTLPDDFNQIINSANTFINMLLAKVNLEQTKPTNITTLSMANCVEKALKQYPFNIGGRGLVQWNGSNNFFFKGDELLITYVLFNLLKNAIYYVTAAGKGNIDIWLEQGAEYNNLHFKDTGKGIPVDILPHIFEQFYSRTRHGTGVGLAFCKMVMTTFNGNISCQSVEGEFAHFILSFPVIEQNYEN
ncbi:MAG: sensor histidine kinase [Gammaproteobacteria bacterium]|jgi:PAS domain S-box-containing protein|nr:sensor histidine kinase [Gammaproteobacteria bacterium]